MNVGGGYGQVSQFLARNTSHLHFIVQDLPGTVETARAQLPQDVQGRVEFVAHDFFTEQTLRGVNVFLLRWIHHNWSDKYCI